jgi:hypothetical protein
MERAGVYSQQADIDDATKQEMENKTAYNNR